MTALSNAIKRKTHKERSQPAARQKFGLLEKHKDYVERARNFHKKDNVIKSLKRKAAERNPDEFYFAMEKARTKGGVHDGRLTEPNKYSQEELRLMKTQDVKYLAMKATQDANKAQRMRQSLHFIGATAAPAAPAAPAKSGPGAKRQKQAQGQQKQQQGQGRQGQAQAQPAQRHTVFVGSRAEAAGFDAAAYFDTPAELLDRTFNRPRAAQLQDAGAVRGRGGKGVEKRKYAAYKELAQRQERGLKVAAVAQRLSYQKEIMGKGRKRKLRPSELEAAGLDPEAAGKVFVWKRERKR